MTNETKTFVASPVRSAHSDLYVTSNVLRKSINCEDLHLLLNFGLANVEKWENVSWTISQLTTAIHQVTYKYQVNSPSQILKVYLSQLKFLFVFSCPRTLT